MKKRIKQLIIKYQIKRLFRKNLNLVWEMQSDENTNYFPKDNFELVRMLSIINGVKQKKIILIDLYEDYIQNQPKSSLRTKRLKKNKKGVLK